MWERISMLPIKARIGFANFVQEFKEDEGGLSGVVVAVLLILVAVLAIVLLWGLLSGWLEELWEDITKGAKDGLV